MVPWLLLEPDISAGGGGRGLDGRSPGPPPVSLIDEISAGTQGFAFKTSLWGD